MAPADRARWLVAAERIATGIAELAHLDAFVDEAHLRVGFSCDGDTVLAAAYVASIGRENVEARRVAPAVAAQPGRALPADEVLLPCRPDAPDEEIRHAVLATLKASHALAFDLAVDAADHPDPTAATAPQPLDPARGHRPTVPIRQG